MPSVQMKSARTAHADAAAAAEDLLTQLGGIRPKLVTMFASSNRDQLALNRAVRERLPKETRLIGASSEGEVDREGIHQGTVVLGALTGDFDVGLGLGTGLSDDAVSAGASAIAHAVSELGITSADLHPRKHVAVVMDDASKQKKEELLLGVLDKHQSLMLVGGGASDMEPDPAKQRGILHVDGEVVGDAALVALFSTDAAWAALRSHWYEPIGQTLKITKVDASYTRALEIDGKPAAQRYADLIGVTVDDLHFLKPNGFQKRPTAVRVGREYFMRAPLTPLPDGSILFANLLEEGSEYEFMNPLDPGSTTRRFFEQTLPENVKSPTAAIFFNCLARKWISMVTGHFGALSDAFHVAPPCVGLNCGFEIYSGFHINATLTSLVFGESR